MRTDVLIEIVDSLLGDDTLCGGCGILRDKGEEDNVNVYGSCGMCRRKAANEVIALLIRSHGAEEPILVFGVNKE